MHPPPPDASRASSDPIAAAAGRSEEERAALEEQNLLLAESASSEEAVREFYETFPYPWKAWTLDRPTDPDLYRIHLNQDVGDWRHVRIPESPRIWVAGCGTNQAVITALRFPTAEVVGSDISATALRLESEQATEAGVSNLELRQASIEEAADEEAFDYVVCTGVVHHNADPVRSVRRLAAALEPHGILELMVYNRFHRIGTSAFQKAVAILSGEQAPRSWQAHVELARRLLDAFPVDNFLAALLSDYRSTEDAEVADAVGNPLEQSFTVASLAELGAAAGLRLLLPCPNRFDIADGRSTWRLSLPDPDLQDRFDRLPDVERWQVVNLLAFERSPMLWFYLERADSNEPTSEREVDEAFLATAFERSPATVERLVRDPAAGRYVPAAAPVSLPAGDPEPDLRPILEAADGKTPVRELLAAAGGGVDATGASSLRIRLTTVLFPRLRAVTPPS